MKSKHLKKFSASSDGGFTLLELVIFVAIFALISVSFVAILVSIVRVQNRETSVAEVNRQSQFVLTTIQRYIEESSVIDDDTPISSTPTSTLVLRMASSTDTFTDPNHPLDNHYKIGDPNLAKTYIYLSGTRIYLKEGLNGEAQPLTSDRVVVDQLDFKRHSNPGAHDSVDIAFSLHYNSPNIQKRFAQALQTSVARINAATFDSDLIPSSSVALNIGALAGAAQWGSINGLIYFSGGNVGIGTNAPAYKLDVLGDLKIDGNAYLAVNSGNNVGIGTTNTLYQKLAIWGNVQIYGVGSDPGVCDSYHVGTIALVPDVGLNDTIKVCVRVINVPTWLYLRATSTAFIQ